jgi:hypothetical protein
MNEINFSLTRIDLTHLYYIADTSACVVYSPELPSRFIMPCDATPLDDHCYRIPMSRYHSWPKPNRAIFTYKLVWQYRFPLNRRFIPRQELLIHPAMVEVKYKNKDPFTYHVLYLAPWLSVKDVLDDRHHYSASNFCLL